MKHTLGAATRPWTAFSFAEACQSIADAGYSDIALFAQSGVFPLTSESTQEDIAGLKTLLQDCQLNPSMLMGRHRMDLPADAADADYRRLIDAAAAVGVRWLLNTGCSDPALYDAYNEFFKRNAPYAKEKGVCLLMKPHGGNGLTADDMKRVVDTVAHEAFSICYDPGNIIYYTKGAVRPETDVLGIREHVSVCIMKDCILKEGEPDVQVLPGEGLVDFSRVLSLLTEGGFDGPLYIECLGGESLEDINNRARRTHAFIQSLSN